MGAQKITVCPNCGDPRLGGNEERTWCMNTDCAYYWLTEERKESAKDWIRRVWWQRVQRPAYKLFFKVFFAIRRWWRRVVAFWNAPLTLPQEWKMSKEEQKWWDEFERKGGVW